VIKAGRNARICKGGEIPIRLISAVIAKEGESTVALHRGRSVGLSFGGKGGLKSLGITPDQE